MKKKYIQVKDYITEKINSGEFKPNSPITSERDLAEILAVNRMTVRRAIEDLMYDGILVRKKGSGTFLTEPKLSTGVLERETFENSKKSIRILSCKSGSDNQYGRKVLSTESDFIRLKRVKSLAQIPYAYEDIYMIPDCSDNLSTSDYNLGLKQLAKKYSLSDIIYVKQRVEAIICLKNTAKILKIKNGTPILQIKTDFIVHDKVMIHCRSYHPGESYLYESETELLK